MPTSPYAFTHSFSRVMPSKPVSSHLNPFWELCREIPVHFYFHLKIMPKKISVHFHALLFESYAGKACTLSLKSFSRVMPAKPMHSHHHSLRSYARKNPVP